VLTVSILSSLWLLDVLPLIAPFSNQVLSIHRSSSGKRRLNIKSIHKSSERIGYKDRSDGKRTRLTVVVVWRNIHPQGKHAPSAIPSVTSQMTSSPILQTVGLSDTLISMSSVPPTPLVRGAPGLQRAQETKLPSQNLSADIHGFTRMSLPGNSLGSLGRRPGSDHWIRTTLPRCSRQVTLYFMLLDPPPEPPKLPGNLDPLMDAMGYSFDERRGSAEVAEGGGKINGPAEKQADIKVDNSPGEGQMTIVERGGCYCWADAGGEIEIVVQRVEVAGCKECGIILEVNSDGKQGISMNLRPLTVFNCGRHNDIIHSKSGAQRSWKWPAEPNRRTRRAKGGTYRWDESSG
jgi:hypothetical protein